MTMPALYGKQWDSYLVEAFGPNLDFSDSDSIDTMDSSEPENEQHNIVSGRTDLHRSRVRTMWTRMTGLFRNRSQSAIAPSREFEFSLSQLVCSNRNPRVAWSGDH